MAEIAVDLREALTQRARNGAPGGLCSRVLAAASRWTVEDVVCTAGPSDSRFEELHAMYRIALVGAGTFACRAPTGRELMTPGSLMLGNAGECFECGHEHGSGDRCLSFGYTPSYFERVAADAGTRAPRFAVLRVPAARAAAALTARAFAAWANAPQTPNLEWEELALRFVAHATRATGSAARASRKPLNAERGVARAIRLIDREPAAALTLGALAREAALTPYHFLRMFSHVTGVTPHRYVLRARLRRAAACLATSERPIIDVAFECGFRDISTFNRVFRAELDVTPRVFRQRHGRRRADRR